MFDFKKAAKYGGQTYNKAYIIKRTYTKRYNNIASTISLTCFIKLTNVTEPYLIIVKFSIIKCIKPLLASSWLVNYFLSDTSNVYGGSSNQLSMCLNL